MHQDRCVQIAREAAIFCCERHDYLPDDELAAQTWRPPRWAIDAMLAAALEAEGQRDAYRSGNTELLELWMKLLAGQDIFGVQERVRDILTGAGLLNADNTPNWDALAARKPKQITWEQAVNECVTDPEVRERLLAMD